MNGKGKTINFSPLMQGYTGIVAFQRVSDGIICVLEWTHDATDEQRRRNVVKIDEVGEIVWIVQDKIDLLSNKSQKKEIITSFDNISLEDDKIILYDDDCNHFSINIITGEIQFQSNEKHMPPYTPGTHVVELKVTKLLSDDEFVRFHSFVDQIGVWMLRRKDIPYKSSGKIDVAKLKQILSITEKNQINIVSRYVPHENDLLIEGHVNMGVDQSIYQYEIKDFNKLLDPAKMARFEVDIALTKLLP